MKFVIAAVVLLAVAMGVQSSLIAGVPGLGWGVHGLGLGLGGVVGPLGVHGPIVAGPHAGWWGAPAAIDISGHGLVAPAHIPAAVNVVSHGGVALAHPAALAGHGATYVAKTRGAVHTAPLAGHINSVASVNAAPAPGTW